PDDDDTRLVYADWLDDHGQPEYAELIRVQTELARLTEAMVCPGETVSQWLLRRRLADRQGGLLRKHEKGGEARSGLGTVDWRFHRGMPEIAHFPNVASFEASAEALFRSAPIRELHFMPEDSTGRLVLERLAASPYLARVRCLSVWDARAGNDVAIM